jgi:hypothetical protein
MSDGIALTDPKMIYAYSSYNLVSYSDLISNGPGAGFVNAQARTGYQLEHSRSCPASKVESGIYLPTLEP